jgi:adenylate cyclase class 2
MPDAREAGGLRRPTVARQFVYGRRHIPNPSAAGWPPLILFAQMAANRIHVETEVKISVPDGSEGVERLAAAGFEVVRPRVFEVNTIYDMPDGRLRTRGALLRIRVAGGSSVVTFKGPADPSCAGYKSRPELEFSVSDPDAAAALLREIGYCPVFRYEKFRTEYRLAGDPSGVVTVDETPIGWYFELEGSPDWIDRAAARLCYTPERYITSNYAELYEEYRRQNRDSGRDLVFPQGNAGK